MIFPDMVGQAPLQQHLQQMVEQNRLSHAILIVGKPGSGVLPLAINFAQNIVSLEDKPAAAAPVMDLFGNPEEVAAPEPEIKIDPQAAGLVHPDLHLSFPVIKSEKTDEPPISADYIVKFREFYKAHPYGTPYEWLQFIGAENKQGNITARECLEIIKKLSLKAYRSRHKVLVMWQPEYLGAEGNRLLKLIEEPPEGTLFVLATESEEEILGTLISRCQVIRIPPIESADIEKALIEKEGVTPEYARQVALISDGSYAQALKMGRHDDENLTELLRDWLNACMARGASAHKRFAMQVSFVDSVSKLGREKQKHLLQYFIHILEQCLRLETIGPARMHLPQAEKDFALKVNELAGLGQQRALADELQKAIYYIERNANPKMLFLALCLKIRAIIYEGKQIGIIEY